MTTNEDGAECWSAEELRAIGFDIEKHVPNCALIECSAFHFLGCEARPGENEGTISLNMKFRVTKPFEWIVEQESSR